jgi:hypothetical protein
MTDSETERRQRAEIERLREENAKLIARLKRAEKLCIECCFVEDPIPSEPRTE